MQDEPAAPWYKIRPVIYKSCIYVILWLAASSLSLNYYADYARKDKHASGDLLAAAKTMFCGLKFDKLGEGWNALWDDKSGTHDEEKESPDPTLATIQKAIEQVGKDVRERTHPPQDLPNSLLKILVVIVISWLWFYTFLLKNELKRAYRRWQQARPPFDLAAYRKQEGRRPIALFGLVAPGLLPRRLWRERPVADLVRGSIAWVLGIWSLLPALVFAVAMHAAYEPAVFVMALAAIFVAAEHYSGLTKAEHEIKASTDDLKRTMGIVLDADGLNEWRTEVYDLYGEAKGRIDAVIRIFDIDPEWWKCAGPGDPWDQYRERCKLSSGAGTLLSVLIKSEARVRFVSDQPLEKLVRLRGAAPSERKEFFRALLGLSWNLVVFDMAYQARVRKHVDRKVSRLRIKISRAPAWMHVVDETVYQVIERGSENATVRQLTHSMTDARERQALSGWAKSNVRRFAQRGGRAEEYVFAALRFAAIRAQSSEGQHLPLKQLLDELGMEDYLKEPKGDFLIAPRNVIDQRMNRSVLLSETTAQSLCMAVFDELLRCRLGKNNCFVQGWADPPDLKLQFLLSELI